MGGFKVFRDFNRDQAWLAGWKTRLDPEAAAKLSQTGVVGRLLEALAGDPSIEVKEVVESFEVHARLRRRLKSARVADLCCGHGLTGLLFALLDERSVLLLDRRRSPQSERVFKAVVSAFPAVAGRVRFVRCKLNRAGDQLEPDTALVAVHACGSRTDRCLELAVARGAAVAVVPCCYTGTGLEAPAALRESLGVPLATDIQRTYFLEAQGYKVQWDSIPEAITPMNRILVARPAQS